MEKRAIIILTFLVGWLILGSLINETTPRPGFAQPEQDPIWAPVERIGLMPFIKGRYGAEIDESLSCTVCLLLNDPKDLAPDSDFILTQYTQKALQKRLGEKVITLEQSEETYERIPRDDIKDSPRSLAKKLGKALNADLMIVGNVWKFRDRVGGSRAISEPASVAFAIYIIEVTSGKLLWKEVFSENDGFTEASDFREIFDLQAEDSCAEACFTETCFWEVSDFQNENRCTKSRSKKDICHCSQK